MTRKLREVGISVNAIHGDFAQKKRLKALEYFRSGDIRVLVATNVAARGLDIEGITHVINYDAPEEAEKGRCIECLACDVTCYFRGAGGGYVELPILGLEEYR